MDWLFLDDSGLGPRGVVPEVHPVFAVVHLEPQALDSGHRQQDVRGPESGELDQLDHEQRTAGTHVTPAGVTGDIGASGWCVFGEGARSAMAIRE